MLTRSQRTSKFSARNQELTDVHLPILPLQLMAVDLEANPFGLDNMKGFDIVAKFEVLVVLCNQVWQEIVSCTWRRDTLPSGGSQGVLGKRWGMCRGSCQDKAFRCSLIFWRIVWKMLQPCGNQKTKA